MATITMFAPTNMLDLRGTPTVNGGAPGFELTSRVANGAVFDATVFIYGLNQTNTTITATDFIIDTSDLGNSPNFIVTGTLNPINVFSATDMSAVLDWAMAGFDIIFGSPGADTMYGGAGNDTYVVGLGDVVTGEDTRPADIDWVQTSTINLNVSSYAGVENGRLTGTGALSMVGTSTANILDASTNTAGNALTGFGGNDTYIVGAGDVIAEVAGAAGGTDLVQSALISLNLASYANVENAQLLGSTSFSLTGNSGINALTGNAGNNVINGGLGNDVLRGGTGSDFFVFNTTLSAATNRDSIADFSAVSDTIRLENAIFTGLGTATGVLASAKFWASSTGVAHDGDDRIIYNTTTGVLTYDSNGSAAGGAVAFAVLSTKPAITAADFVVI